MSNVGPPLNDGEERDLDLLLREVGPRDQPADEITRSIYQSVRSDWEDVVARRRSSRRTVVSLAIAASLTAVAVVVWVGIAQRPLPDKVIAHVQRVSGSALQGERALIADAAVHTRDLLRTEADTRVALRLAEDFSMRLDENTEVQFTDEAHLVLNRGTLFVDDDPRPPNHPLNVTTRYGEIVHRGTQYEVRVSPSVLRVRVREGQVQLRSSDGNTMANSGEQLLVSTRGVNRSDIDVFGAEWQWTQQIAPPFEIENHSVEEFLTWVSRETGRKLTYASAHAREEAQRVVLHGSIAGLVPEAAMAAVLSTTSFTHTDTPDRIVVALSP